MTMNLVGWQQPFEVPGSMKNMDEDIVYSVIERYSRKASEPTTTRCSSITSLILEKSTGKSLGTFLFCAGTPQVIFCYKSFFFFSSEILYITDQYVRFSKTEMSWIVCPSFFIEIIVSISSVL